MGNVYSSVLCSFVFSPILLLAITRCYACSVRQRWGKLLCAESMFLRVCVLHVPLFVRDRNHICLSYTNTYTKRETSWTYIYLGRQKEQKDNFWIFFFFIFGGWGKSIRFFLRKQCEIYLFIPWEKVTISRTITNLCMVI